MCEFVQRRVHADTVGPMVDHGRTVWGTHAGVAIEYHVLAIGHHTRDKPAALQWRAAFLRKLEAVPLRVNVARIRWCMSLEAAGPTVRERLANIDADGAYRTAGHCART